MIEMYMTIFYRAGSSPFSTTIQRAYVSVFLCCLLKMRCPTWMFSLNIYCSFPYMHNNYGYPVVPSYFSVYLPALAKCCAQLMNRKCNLDAIFPISVLTIFSIDVLASKMVQLNLIRLTIFSFAVSQGIDARFSMLPGMIASRRGSL